MMDIYTNYIEYLYDLLEIKDCPKVYFKIDSSNGNIIVDKHGKLYDANNFPSGVSGVSQNCIYISLLKNPNTTIFKAFNLYTIAAAIRLYYQVYCIDNFKNSLNSQNNSNPKESLHTIYKWDREFASLDSMPKETDSESYKDVHAFANYTYRIISNTKLKEDKAYFEFMKPCIDKLEKNYPAYKIKQLLEKHKINIKKYADKVDKQST